MIATTSKIWMNPPKVKDVTRPSSHRISKITASVQSKSIASSFSFSREVGSWNRAGIICDLYDRNEVKPLQRRWPSGEACSSLGSSRYGQRSFPSSALGPHYALDCGGL